MLELLKYLASVSEVYVPGEKSGISQFVPWDGETVPNLSGANTTMPPKDILFPKTECMYTYGRNGISENTDSVRRTLFGVRPCDAAAIERMDMVFLREGYTDEFYARRRDNLIIVAAACTDEGENCFCSQLGIDKSSAPTADILLRADGSLTACSELGSDLLARAGCSFTKAEPCEAEPMPFAPAENLPKVFDDRAFWERFTQPCLKCGTCAFVCPTCYCFDINNEADCAYRSWDSCVFNDYNLAAGGHNSRPTSLERLRNRYMHKLSYFYERHDVALCTGCGRCVSKCPAHLDIRDVLDAAMEVQA